MGRQAMWMATLAAAGALAAPAQGQEWTVSADDERCERRWSGGDDERHCEVREAVFAFDGSISVDGGSNGGVTVRGWDRSDVQVFAVVQAWAREDRRARDIAADIRLETGGGDLAADGPNTGRREGWAVSWEVMVPRRADLDVETNNGGISVEGVDGTIDFDAVNGGVRLVAVGGDVTGETTNGGLHVELVGDHWSGRGLDARTTNGGIRVLVPENYSAQLETGTVNGGIDIDFPVVVSGRIGRRLETTLGDGGPPIRVTTTNGSVRIARR